MRVKRRLTEVFLLVVFLVALGGISVNAADGTEMILINGKIITLEEKGITEAVVIRDDKIFFTGSSGEALKLKSKNGTCQIIDLKGKTVIPGLHDAHLHFEAGAEMLKSQLTLRFLNLQEIKGKIKEVINASPGGAVIWGHNYNHAFFKKKQLPTRYDLDKVAPDNPVIIERVDGHSVWLNSKALEAADITKDTKDIPGGEIMRFEDGSPTGILKENALSLVEKIKKQKRPKMVIPGQSGQDALEMAIQYANKLGLTCVTTSGTPALVEHLKKLKKEGKLTLKFNVWFPIVTLKDYLAAGLSFHQGDEWVRVSFLKIFADGTIGSASAAMFNPYLHRPESRGILIQPTEELNRLVAEAHRNNWPIGVHAIGNRGVHLVLNAVEKAQDKYGPKPQIRHRIEHSQFVTDSDLKRYKTLGVIPSMQPTHCTTDLLVVENRIGSERAKQGYRWNSFHKIGVMLAFGTDWPVEPLDPRRGLYSSIERKNIETNQPKGGWFPGEQITLIEAIKYYTLGSAYASCDEAVTGSIKKGKLADLTIFDGDLLETARRDKRAILQLPIYMTVVNGKIIYKR